MTLSNMRHLRNLRDERGWRIPRPGTKSRQIYDLLIVGKRRFEIVAATGISDQLVSAFIWKIKHPELANWHENQKRDPRPEPDLRAGRSAFQAGQGRCSLEVECGRYGICFAASRGMPEKCGRQ